MPVYLLLADQDTALMLVRGGGSIHSIESRLIVICPVSAGRSDFRVCLFLLSTQTDKKLTRASKIIQLLVA